MIKEEGSDGGRRGGDESEASALMGNEDKEDEQKSAEESVEKAVVKEVVKLR